MLLRWIIFTVLYAAGISAGLLTLFIKTKTNDSSLYKTNLSKTKHQFTDVQMKNLPENYCG